MAVQFLFSSLVAAQQAAAPPASATAADGGVAAAPALPPEHVPTLALEVQPTSGVMTGDVVHVTLRALALEGDDVTIPEQSFSPFEVSGKRARVEPAKDGHQSFVFNLDLLVLEAGEHALQGIELRVVTKDGFVGSTRSQPLAIKAQSLLANEPNAQPKPATNPVVVMQDDYTLLYILGGLAGAALIALITWLVMRYLQRRQKPVPPPPPPRPPWEIAVERLAELRRRKPAMIADGQAAQFVDEVSDVVRAYLGGLFHFDGLESTTDEMLELLRSRAANPGLWQEVSQYLRRCDLVKFAKVEPDQDEADLVFSKAQDIVQFSMPMGGLNPRPGAPEGGFSPHGPSSGGQRG